MQNSSRLPLLQYADNRELRKDIYEAYINRGNNGDANDNKEILKKIISLRLEKANLLGFDCYSNFVLDENMAKKRANGEGSIRKRSDGRWEGRYTVGYDENGKVKMKNVLGKTQAEVKEKLKEKIEEAMGLVVLYRKTSSAKI